MTITFARAGGPPINCMDLEVFDGEVRLDACTEVDTERGYAIVHVKDEDGKFVIDGDNAVLQRIESENLSIRTAS